MNEIDAQELLHKIELFKIQLDETSGELDIRDIENIIRTSVSSNSNNNCSEYIYGRHKDLDTLDTEHDSFITDTYCKNCGHSAYYDSDYGQQFFKHCPHCGYYMINWKTAI
jgi:predicted nucleic-acid-binding Zn-ribbon protein